MKKRLLFITDGFLPINSGGNVDVYGQLELLSNFTNLYIDVIISDSRKNILKYNKLYEFENIATITIYEQHKYSKLAKIFSKLPYNCFWFYDLMQYQSKYTYDFVLCQSEYSAFITANKSIVYDKLLIRVHNDEISLFLNNNRLETNLIKKALGFLNVMKLRKIRNYYYNQATLLFISATEAKNLSVLYPSSLFAVIPPYYHRIQLCSKNTLLGKPKQVLFFGGFSRLNLEGLKWYFNHIHYKLKQLVPDYAITIAGADCKEDISWLICLAESDITVNVIVNVEQHQIVSLYDRHYIAINPMQNGTGTKIKTTEYIYHGLPVVTTLIGSEGNLLQSGEGQIIASTTSSFVNAMVSLITDESYAHQVLLSGQLAIQQLYVQNLENIAKIIGVSYAKQI